MSEGPTGKPDQQNGEMRDFTPSSAANLAVHLEPGTILFEKFKVVKLLGRGGMGSVYQVQHLHLRTEYALKCLNRQQHNDAAWRRFENEARAANKLDHPNLIKVHDSGLMADGQPYFVMDLVNGITLADEIKKVGRLPVDVVFKLFIQVGFALSYAHERGVVHRDIKPTNIMLLNNDDGTLSNSVKVVDFGIAKLTGQEEFNQQTLTRTGEIFGSPLYMSPEQCMGIAVDHRSDLYSLGCVMYEALTGAPPFVADSALATMLKHQSEKPLSLKEASMGIEFPEQLESLVQRLLEKDVADRYSNASLLTADLVALERNLHTGATMTLNVENLKQKEISKSQWHHFSDRKSTVISVTALLFAYGLGVWTGVYMPKHKEPSKEVVVEPKTIQLRDDSLPPVELDPRGQLYVDDGKTIFSDSKRILAKPIVTTASFFSEGTGKVRVFHFPKNVSLGTTNSIKRPKPDNVEMKGDVSMTVPILCDVNEVFLNTPELYSKFRPDEISFLNFTRTNADITPFLARAVKGENLESIGLNNCGADAADLKLVEGVSKLSRLTIHGSTITVKDLLGFKKLHQLVWLVVGGMKGVKPLLKELTKSTNLIYLGCPACDRGGPQKLGH